MAKQGLTLVYFEGCPNVEVARELLRSAGASEWAEVIHDRLAPGDRLLGLSSPAILRGDELIAGQSCDPGSRACTFPLPSPEDIKRLLDAKSRSGASIGPTLGAGGSLGLAALIGTCAGSCGLLAFPLATFLASIGLSALVPWVPYFRYPLIGVALVLAAISFVRVWKRGKPREVILAGLVLAGAALWSVTMLFTTQETEAQGTAAYIRHLSPETQDVIRRGIYLQWIHLGRAPSAAEIQKALGETDSAKIDKAFEELAGTEFSDMFVPGTRSIRWFWPLSTQDHGVHVQLSGEKTVFARCAVDALGMSKMFGKPAKIAIQTPHWKKSIEFEMNATQLTRFDPQVVVSRGNGCDDLLFFSSPEEFTQFKTASGRTQLKMMRLDEAVKWGLASFGSIFEG